MTPDKKPATITKTKRSGVTQFIEHETEVALSPMPDTGRPYVLESAEFDAFILTKRAAAAREIEGIDAEISRLHVEIEARLDRRQDLMNVVIRADAALSLEVESARPGPRLVEKEARGPAAA